MNLSNTLRGVRVEIKNIQRARWRDVENMVIVCPNVDDVALASCDKWSTGVKVYQAELWGNGC